MAEDMTFLPKSQVLTLEELETLTRAFVKRGVKKIRITGGEPLVRKNIMQLFNNLGEMLDGGGLEELTLTTNASQMERFADDLYKAGVRRINVSLDSRDPETFAKITRGADLNKVMRGLQAAKDAGLHVKINTVALRDINEDEIDDIIAWCGEQGFDMTLIETMPLGDIEGDRTDHYLPLSVLRTRLEQRWSLTDIPYKTGGPARYTEVGETGRKLGFITPLTHNFCESCNRVRLTCTGEMFMCLGQEDKKDFRELLRGGASEDELNAAIDEAIARKPKGHDFVIDREHKAPAVSRHMSVTGG